MIINDSNENWEIILQNGITIIVKPNEGYDPLNKQVLTINKPS